MFSVKKMAKITGTLYLIVIICAGFSEGYVRSGLIVSGDAAATVNNITESEWLFRLGFVTDLIAFMSDLAVSVLLYLLLRPVSKTLSLLAASFRLVAHPAIAAVNMLNHFIALLLLSGSGYLSAFSGDQLNAMVLLFLNLHDYGYLIGGAFFSVHLFFLGILLLKADFFPSVLGILILLASAGYITESFGDFLFPGNEEILSWIVGIPAVLGELSFTLYLLIFGLRDKSKYSMSTV